MGSIIGSLVEGLFEELSELADLSRENIAKKLRKLADNVERGDLVPEEALDRARARHRRATAIRDRLPGE